LKQRAATGEGPAVTDDLSAEIQFIPSEDIGLGTAPRKIHFGYDEGRLKEDLMALKDAREIVSQWVMDTTKEVSEAPEEWQPLIEKLRNATLGDKVTPKRSRTVESYQFEGDLDEVFKVDQSKAIDDYLRQSKEIFDYRESRKGVYEETKATKASITVDPSILSGRTHPMRSAAKQAELEAKEIARQQAAQEEFNKKTFSKSRKPPARTSEERIVGDPKKFTEPIQKQFQYMQDFHDNALSLQREFNKFEYTTGLEEAHREIQAALTEGEVPPTGVEFGKTLDALEKTGFIGFQESLKAWKLWRVAMADFLIARAKEAEQEFEVASATGTGTKEFEAFNARVEKLREFMVRGLGKKTDLYTKDRRLLVDESTADKAGLLFTPQQIFEKTKQPFGDDEFTRGAFNEIIDKVESGVFEAPEIEIKKIFDQLG
ncbi:unnamed protein product, partial [marine sediment metagenome]